MLRAAPVFASQNGLITRDQAVELGLSHRQIDHALATGLWWAVHPEVYTLAGMPHSRTLVLNAASTWVGPRGGLSHLTGAEAWELGPSVERVHTTVRLPSHLRTTRSVVVHRTRTMPDDHVVERSGLRVTSPARTILDCAPLMTPDALDSMVSTALRAGLVEVESFSEFISTFGKGRRGQRALRRSLSRRSTASSRESELEDRTSSLLRRHRIPDPVPQFEVLVEGERFRLDFAWPQHLVALECDGWAFHGDREAFASDRRRRSTLAAAGWRVLVVTYQDVVDRPKWVAEQVARALNL